MSAEVEEDDIIVVVVKEEDSQEDNNQQELKDMIIDEVTGQLISTNHLKQETCDETFYGELYNVLQKYGTPMELLKKKEKKKKKKEDEFLDDDSQDSDYVPKKKHVDSDEKLNVTKSSTPKKKKKRKKEDEFLDDDSHDSNYVSKKKHVESDKKLSVTKSSTPKKRLHFKLLAPHEAHSIVEDLRIKYPKFVDDENALILFLADMMKSVKPSPPPDGYCTYFDVKSFKCAICPKITKTKGDSVRHYINKHGPRYLTCYSCGADFRFVSNLYKHEKICPYPDAEIVLRARANCIGIKGAKNAKRPFLSIYKPWRLEKEQEKQKESQTFVCDICGAVFRLKSNLDSHELLHAGVRPYKCEHCGASYTSRSRLLHHLQLHAGDRYECDICGRVYPIKSSLATHMNSHSNRRYLCPYHCGKEYASHLTLGVHIDRTHLNKPPPCACNVCPKRFFKMSLLKVHMKKEHGLLLMTKNMLIRQLPRMDPTRAKAMFGDVAAFVHNDDLNIMNMESAQNHVDETIPSDQNATHDMPDIDNQDSNVVTDHAFSNELSEEFTLPTKNPGFTINIDELGRVQIEKENYEVSSQETLIKEEPETDDWNIDSHTDVVVEQESYPVPVCQDISLEEVLKSNKKFKVVMINKL